MLENIAKLKNCFGNSNFPQVSSEAHESLVTLLPNFPELNDLITVFLRVSLYLSRRPLRYFFLVFCFLFFATSFKKI